MLIKCVECGKEISDKSETCPNCGCPTKESVKELEKNIQKAENKDKLFYTCPICKKQYEDGTLECDVCGYTSIISTIQNTNTQNQPMCPICKSTNLSKISTAKKVAKVGFFGIFGAGDIGKTWKCNNCGSKF